ncbi:MAG: cytochrome c [Zoogloeaceae bacterium]|jgi:cytochrome c556|nr:cytochrome c [Zoogloeaceae bacterium]
MMKKIALAAFAFAVAGSALAIEPDKAIKTRQAGYAYIGWNMNKIKDNVEGTYNQAEVIKAANAIAAIANSGMGALYVKGSEKDVGNVKTYVKPEFFSKPQDAAKYAQAFTKEADELARIAAVGTVAEVKAQHGKVGGTCKACHDDFKMKN